MWLHRHMRRICISGVAAGRLEVHRATNVLAWLYTLAWRAGIAPPFENGGPLPGSLCGFLYLRCGLSEVHMALRPVLRVLQMPCASSTQYVSVLRAYAIREKPQVGVASLGINLGF
mmetsp:Transcript_90683/g.292710  ORF Transcript_90683/g.292710 Transcript_90683/m.292710 type:complete len:116 (+) Transcript_90683:425-772(+)